MGRWLLVAVFFIAACPGSAHRTVGGGVAAAPEVDAEIDCSPQMIPGALYTGRCVTYWPDGRPATAYRFRRGQVVAREPLEPRRRRVDAVPLLRPSGGVLPPGDAAAVLYLTGQDPSTSIASEQIGLGVRVAFGDAEVIQVVAGCTDVELHEPGWADEGDVLQEASCDGDLIRLVDAHGAIEVHRGGDPLTRILYPPGAALRAGR